jgi:hypothetical protein
MSGFTASESSLRDRILAMKVLGSGEEATIQIAPV